LLAKAAVQRAQRHGAADNADQRSACAGRPAVAQRYYVIDTVVSVVIQQEGSSNRRHEEGTVAAAAVGARYAALSPAPYSMKCRFQPHAMSLPIAAFATFTREYHRPRTRSAADIIIIISFFMILRIIIIISILHNNRLLSLSYIENSQRQMTPNKMHHHYHFIDYYTHTIERLRTYI